MSIFSWLTRRKAPTKNNSSSVGVSLQPDAETSEKDIFKSPTLLAEWVDKHWLVAFPLENNYDSLPDEECRKDLNITYEQRERYIREIPTLRIAGISLFVKHNYDDKFWLKYSRDVYPLLGSHLYGEDFKSEQLTSLADAIEKYVTYAENSDEQETCLLYMHRVYDDSDNFVKLLAGGVGYLSVQWLMDAYTIFRDSYFNATQGMTYETYETYELLMDTIENVGGKQA